MDTFEISRRPGHAPHLLYSRFHDRLHIAVCFEVNPRPREGTDAPVFAIPISPSEAELTLAELGRRYPVTATERKGQTRYEVSRRDQPAALPVSTAAEAQTQAEAATGLRGPSMPLGLQTAMPMPGTLRQALAEGQARAGLAMAAANPRADEPGFRPAQRAGEGQRAPRVGTSDDLGEAWATRHHD